MTGDAVMCGDAEGVAGAVIELAEDLHVGAGASIVAGQAEVGEVGLPALVGGVGLELQAVALTSDIAQVSEEGKWYCFEVSSDSEVWAADPGWQIPEDGKRGRPRSRKRPVASSLPASTVAQLAATLADEAWVRHRVTEGAKGPRAGKEETFEPGSVDLIELGTEMLATAAKRSQLPFQWVTADAVMRSTGAVVLAGR